MKAPRFYFLISCISVATGCATAAQYQWSELQTEITKAGASRTACLATAANSYDCEHNYTEELKAISPAIAGVAESRLSAIQSLMLEVAEGVLSKEEGFERLAAVDRAFVADMTSTLEIIQTGLEIEHESELARRRQGFLTGLQVMQGYSAAPATAGYSIAPASGPTCFKTSEAQAGMNKICYYNCLGSTAALTIGAVDLCPITHEF